MNYVSNSYTGVQCPFCGEDDFDLIGLKRHFQRGHCEKFEATDPAPKYGDPCDPCGVCGAEMWWYVPHTCHGRLSATNCEERK